MTRHTIIPTSHGTSLLVIEACSSTSPQSSPRIRCHRRGGREQSTISTGRTIGQDLGPICALVAKVIPQSMVEITGRIGSGAETNHLLHVGGSFELTLLKSGLAPISQAEIDSELLSSLPAAVSLEVGDEDQTLLFSIARPLWLQQILNAQLHHWFKHQAETYYQFSPWPMIGEEYVRGDQCGKLSRRNSPEFAQAG